MTLGNCVARKRAASGLRQQELASRAGISRQRLSVIESGRAVPSAGVALRLARVLGCKTDDLFWIEDTRVSVAVEVAGRGPEGRRRATGASRVALASIGGRWVAHRLSSHDGAALVTAADGLLKESATAARATLLSDEASARATLVCSGCAPGFGILAARLNAGRAGDRVVWLDRSSHDALELLARDQIHVAGAHLYDDERREFNVPFIERRLAGRQMLVFNLARWEAGLILAPGNPRRIRGIGDLAREDVSFVRRPPGTAAHSLVERLAREAGLAASVASRGSLTASGHGEVARLVAHGVADVGLAIAAVARPLDLDFIPLAEERFDLVLPKALAEDGRVVRLLETLSSRAFRREMESLGGHVVRETGKLIAEIARPT